MPSIGQFDFNGEYNLNVYPNPFTNQVKIEFDEEMEDVTLSVSDAMGKEVYTEQYDYISKASLNLDVKPGLYFLNLTSKSHRKTFSLVKH